MVITNFDDLLKAAREQPEPQRLLFVFAKPVLPKDADEDEISRFNAGTGGALQPLMSVDKRPQDLTSFDALVEEASQMGDDAWHLALVGSIGGEGGEPPTVEATEGAIEYMIKTIQGGGDIGQFLVFNRDGEPLQITLES